MNEKRLSFDPELAFSDAKQQPRELRREAVAEVVRERSRQREGLAIIQTFLIDAAESNPDITSKELLAQLDELQQDITITDNQRNQINKIVAAYFRRRKKMHASTRNAQSPEDYYEAVIGWRPEGQVRLIDGAVAYHFQLANPREYAALYTQKRPRSVTSEDLNKAKLSGGFARRGALYTAERMVWNAHERTPTFVHEQMHAWYGFFQETIGEPESYRLSSTDSKRVNIDANPDHKVSILTALFRRQRRTVENRAQDEMLAINRNRDRSVGTLATNELYDYARWAWDSPSTQTFFQQLDAAGKELAQKAFKQVFEIEYRQLLLKAQAAFNLLISPRGGFDRQQAIHFLMYFPLRRWSVEVGRMLRAQEPLRD